MGGRMAVNLTSKGTRVKVYDAVPSACKSIPNAEICATPQEAAKDADVVITMLPNGKSVREVIVGEHGVLKTIAENGFVVDCSTVEPSLARELHEVTGC